MTRERLQLALERLAADQWKIFEEFASDFLTSQYPNLRTVAATSGDQGRDAELFFYDDQIPTVIQYSVSKDWKKKIRETAKRISKTLPDKKILIYVTNQSILSKADALKMELQKFGLLLDIHDINWFLERFAGDEHREATSESLARKIVDPYLASKGVLEHSAPTLSSTESRAAVTFLQLQWEDDTREKGLTKLSFDALVRTVLRNTNSESRLPRSEIHDQIKSMFPDHDPERLSVLIDSSLSKLTKRFIRHWPKSDEFCLTHEESERVRGRLAKIEVANTKLDSEIQLRLMGLLDDNEKIEKLTELIRMTVNHYLLEQGEIFASAVTNDKSLKIGIEDLDDSINQICRTELQYHTPSDRESMKNIIHYIVKDLLREPTQNVQDHLRAKADAYTLFAFLGRTPDIQKAISKMFSYGTIWLDTNIVLPLIAEELISEGPRQFSQMIKIASMAGLELRVTSGVLEEVERHINRCLIYRSMAHSQWTGSVPFLIDAYMRSGRDLGTFQSWIENFEGQDRPVDDLAEYFKDFYAIEREDLEADELKATGDLRTTVQEAWHSAHTRRRSSGDEVLDENAVHKLVRHDVENYVGVIERRRNDETSSLGYSAWWLTLDRAVRQVDEKIKSVLRHNAPPTPVMSADFLVNYLSIGPIRSRKGKNIENTLPIALDATMLDTLPEDLLREAERIRQEAGELPEYVIRRRVRDYLDAARRRPGRFVKEGFQTVLDTI